MFYILVKCHFCTLQYQTFSQRNNQSINQSIIMPISSYFHAVDGHYKLFDAKFTKNAQRKQIAYIP